MDTVPLKVISIIVPVYNEAESIGLFYSELTGVINTLPYDFEIIFVNDGSRDQTLPLAKSLPDERIRVINLSRNFGKEIALTAGIDHACGDAVIVMDVDLQDPPSLIPELINRWQEGFDIVNARRLSREGESWLKKSSAYIFYRLMSRVADIEIPADTGDFRLLSRHAAIQLSKLRENNRYMKGLFAWVGGKQTTVDFHRNERAEGCSKWNYWKLWNLAIEGLTSFSTLPLKCATYFGLLMALLAFVYGAYFIMRTLVFGNPVPGYPSLMIAILFIGGLQLLFIGIIGEYLARIFNETKHRPLYLTQDDPVMTQYSKNKTMLDDANND